MQLSHAPPGRSAGNVGLIGSQQRGRGRGAVSQSWTTVSLVLVACVTFLAGYFLGGSGGLGGLGGRGGRGQGFESPPKASTSTSTSWSVGDHHESSRGHNQGLHADALHLDDKSSASIARSNRKNQGNVTFEEIIAESGALRDYPPLTDIGLTGHPFYTVQPMQLLSWHPRAYLFPKFIDRDMAQHVIDLAASRLAPSGLALREGDTMDSTVEIRTSQGTFLSRGSDPDGVLAYIEDKIAVLTGIPAGHGEPFNVLRYENGQHYDSHYDSFDEAGYGKQSSQRVATVLVYLSDVEEGGETSFLFEGVGGTERLKTVDYKKCDTGIKVTPRAGDALLFWSVHPDMTRDLHSLHGGCPVARGTKWTATKWIRDRCMSGAGASCSSESVN